MMKNRQYTDAQLEAYRQHLIRDYKTYSAGTDASHFDVQFEPGSKYTKVLAVSWNSRSAHSFIDAQGKIWKAASWKAPAKNFTRGDITTGNFGTTRWCGV